MYVDELAALRYVRNDVSAGRWTQNAFARTRTGRKVKTFDRLAIKWCLSSLIYLHTKNDLPSRRWLVHAVTNEIQRVHKGRYTSIQEFNDSVETTLQDLQNILANVCKAMEP